MSTLATMPLSKARLPLSPFGSGSAAPGEPVVLIRLRDLNVREEATTDSAASDAPEQAEPHADESKPQGVQAAVLTAMQTSRPPVESQLPVAVSATVETAAESASETPVTTPSRRSRQRRETPPAKRDWSPTIWQGTVGLLLVSMVIIVYFIMAGGGKKGMAGPASTPAKESPLSPDDLETPEIWIPEPRLATTELSEADFPGRQLKPRHEDPALESRASTRSNLARDMEELSQEPTTRPAEREESREPVDIREAARPRTDTPTYPVSPAGATYPVTDPGRYRYPDDTRPGDSAAQRGAVSAGGRPPSRPSEWNERERVGVGSGGTEFQPATKMR